MRDLLHPVELRLAVMAAVLLLIAQCGAMSHAYTHSLAALASQQTGATDHEPCNDCLAYAPLLAGAGSPAALAAIGPPEPCGVMRSPANSRVECSMRLAFRSRAPPRTA